MIMLCVLRMKNRKPKLNHEYHDSAITSFEVRNGDELTLSVSLDGHWNKKIEENAHLVFRSVKNANEVENRLIEFKSTNPQKNYIAEIIRILRTEKGFLFDLAEFGTFEVHSHTLIEI